MDWETSHSQRVQLHLCSAAKFFLQNRFWCIGYRGRRISNTKRLETISNIRVLNTRSQLVFEIKTIKKFSKLNCVHCARIRVGAQRKFAGIMRSGQRSLHASYQISDDAVVFNYFSAVYYLVPRLTKHTVHTIGLLPIDGMCYIWHFYYV